MDIRFRYLAADGREVHVATSDVLAAKVAAGEVSEDTLVFDAVSGGWAPLRNHEVFFSEILPSERHEADTAASALTAALPDLSFTLEAEAAAPDTDEVVAHLLREREYAPPLTRRVSAVLAVPTTPPGESPLSEPIASPSPEPSMLASGLDALQDEGPAPSTDPATSWALSAAWETPEGPALGAARHASREQRPRVRAVPLPPPNPARPVRMRAAEEGRRAVRALGAAGAALSVIGVVLIAAVVSDDVERRPVAAQAAAPLRVAEPFRTALAGDRPLGLADQLAVAESAALQQMVFGMDSLRVVYGVDRVPRIWLEGIYLAQAGGYPEVRYFWERYRTYVEQVRALEPELFRRSVMARLETESVTGAMVSMRLARAMKLFEQERPGREAVYLSMLELADASLALHDLLVEREEDIAYEPVSAGVSREPVVEAVALDPEVGVEMNRMLDRIFAAIEGVYGERIAPREELAGALAHGLRSGGTLAVTR